MTVVLIIVGVILLIGLIFVLIRNSIIGSRNKVDEAWSGIDVQLKRRHDLVPNLVEAVKGYAQHERETFEKVTQARAAAMQASGPGRGGAGRGHAEPGARRAAGGRRAVPGAARDRELPAALAQPLRARGRDPGLAADLQLERAGLQHEDPGLPELDRRRAAAASPRASSSRSRTPPSARCPRSRSPSRRPPRRLSSRRGCSDAARAPPPRPPARPVRAVVFGAVHGRSGRQQNASRHPPAFATPTCSATRSRSRPPPTAARPATTARPTSAHPLARLRAARRDRRPTRRPWRRRCCTTGSRTPS